MAAVADLLHGRPLLPMFIHATESRRKSMRRVPSRYDITLRDLDDDEKPHVHYSWTILDAVFHLSRPLLPTDLRFPRATTTEKLKEAPCLTEGLYIWEMDWPSETRGSHAVVGVATKGGLMYPVKRKADSEEPAHRSWGWDLVTTKLMVDGFVHDGSDNKCYPLQQGSSLYVVPDKFHVVLDMSNGTLSFIVDGKWLGTALSGISGHCLYPIVTSRQVVLDMMDGTLSFIVNGKWLGTAQRNCRALPVPDCQLQTG
ncbi:protein gustavus-like [Homalodisca vitripennis]|uniref:protein gustavus-like n=1 Tax=Homalodisca vitripennis TaxID=197043 RepID=UPI001EE9E363|nr:protein gustavus-like [Homalodisca vitripennis]